MKKMLLSPVLLAILATSAHAADSPTQTNSTDTTNGVVSLPPAPSTLNNETQPIGAVPTPTVSPVVNCDLHIPASQVSVDATLITTWASKAALQSFSFSPVTIDNQLDALKACYTEAGWKGFYDAIQKSGNVNSIKSQQLTVSSQEEGEATINTVKDNQWKVILPIQVVYQNDKEKVTQHLNVEILIGRKATGDLGIMQMIATPRPVVEAPQPTKPIENPEPIQAVVPAPIENTEAAPTPDEAPTPPGTINQNNTVPASKP